MGHPLHPEIATVPTSDAEAPNDHLHSDFPEWYTARLRIRHVLPSDAESMHRLRSYPDVMRHIGRPLSTGVAEAADLITRICEARTSRTGITWAIERTSEFVGTIGLYGIDPAKGIAEVGFLLMPHAWGQGYMSEALHAIVKYAKGIGLRTLEARTNEQNKRSITCLFRRGFKTVLLAPSDRYVDDDRKDLVLFVHALMDPIASDGHNE